MRIILSCRVVLFFLNVCWILFLWHLKKKLFLGVGILRSLVFSSFVWDFRIYYIWRPKQLYSSRSYQNDQSDQHENRSNIPIFDYPTIVFRPQNIYESARQTGIDYQNSMTKICNMRISFMFNCHCYISLCPSTIHLYSLGRLRQSLWINCECWWMRVVQCLLLESVFD